MLSLVDVIFHFLGLFAQSENPSLMIKLKVKFLDAHLFFTFVTLVIANNFLLLFFMCLLEFLGPNLSSYEIIR